MANTPAVYPTSITTFTVKQNKIDVYNDDHINKLQNEVVALQTYIGTNPHGDQSTLSHRIRSALSGSGGFVLTTGVPTTTYPGMFYYRTDSETLFGIRSDNVPQAIGGSLSNQIFSFAGKMNGTSSSNVWSSTTDGAYSTSIASKLKKISGMTSITVWTYVSCSEADQTGNCRITIGSASGTTQGVVGNTYNWASCTIDVTGLANGTTFDLIVDLKATAAGRTALLGSITGIVQ